MPLHGPRRRLDRATDAAAPALDDQHGRRLLQHLLVVGLGAVGEPFGLDECRRTYSPLEALVLGQVLGDRSPAGRAFAPHRHPRPCHGIFGVAPGAGPYAQARLRAVADDQRLANGLFSLRRNVDLQQARDLVLDPSIVSPQRPQDLAEDLPLFAERVHRQARLRVDAARKRNWHDHVAVALPRSPAHAAADDLDHIGRAAARGQQRHRIETRTVRPFPEDPDVRDATRFLGIRPREITQRPSPFTYRMPRVEVLHGIPPPGTCDAALGEIPLDLRASLVAVEPLDHLAGTLDLVQERQRAVHADVAVVSDRPAGKRHAVDQPGECLAGRQPARLLRLLEQLDDAVRRRPGTIIDADGDDPVVRQELLVDRILVRQPVRHRAEDRLVRHARHGPLATVETGDLRVARIVDAGRRRLVEPVPGRKRRLLVAQREYPQALGLPLALGRPQLGRPMGFVQNQNLRELVLPQQRVRRVVRRLVRREDDAEVGRVRAGAEPVGHRLGVLGHPTADFGRTDLPGVPRRVRCQIGIPFDIDVSRRRIAAHRQRPHRTADV